MPSYNTVTFDKNKIIIIIDNDDKIWFNAKQLCVALNYKDTTKKIADYIDNEDKLLLKKIKINFEMSLPSDTIFMNENGLYSILILSPLKNAIVGKKFVKWIRNDVFPVIIKNNTYSSNTELTPFIKKKK